MEMAQKCTQVVDTRRKEIGMTTRALSRKSGVPENALYGILNNKRKMTATELLALSSALNLKIEDFEEDRTA